MPSLKSIQRAPKFPQPRTPEMKLEHTYDSVHGEGECSWR